MLFTFTLHAGGIVGLIFLILGLVWWFPVGLIILIAFVVSRAFGCWHRPQFAGGIGAWDAGRSRWENRMADRPGRSRGPGNWRQQPSSNNRAFDEYRSETLGRLEDEEREFKEFLERLRAARDRAELDQFLNERRSAPRPDTLEPHA
jgi:hypothetical protein